MNNQFDHLNNYTYTPMARFMTTNQLAELTGKNSSTIRRWIYAKKVHAIKQGRDWVIAVVTDANGDVVLDLPFKGI